MFENWCGYLSFAFKYWVATPVFKHFDNKMFKNWCGYLSFEFKYWVATAVFKHFDNKMLKNCCGYLSFEFKYWVATAVFKHFVSRMFKNLCVFDAGFQKTLLRRAIFWKKSTPLTQNLNFWMWFLIQIIANRLAA